MYVKNNLLLLFICCADEFSSIFWKFFEFLYFGENHAEKFKQIPLIYLHCHEEIEEIYFKWNW